MRGKHPDIRHCVTTHLVPAKTKLSWSLGSRGACRHLEHVTRGGQNTSEENESVIFFWVIMKRNCNLRLCIRSVLRGLRWGQIADGADRDMTRNEASQEREPGHDNPRHVIPQSRHRTHNAGDIDTAALTRGGRVCSPQAVSCSVLSLQSSHDYPKCDTCSACHGKKMCGYRARSTMVGPNWWHTPHC